MFYKVYVFTINWSFCNGKHKWYRKVYRKYFKSSIKFELTDGYGILNVLHGFSANILIGFLIFIFDD